MLPKRTPVSEKEIEAILAAGVATHEDASSAAQVYWNKALPNTSMPPAIHDLLHPTDIKITSRKGGPYSPVFEKDMLSGTMLTMDFIRSTSTFGGTFISRQAANSIPFSSADLPAILDRFSIDPNSPKADSIKKTINDCEMPPADGKLKYCTTSPGCEMPPVYGERKYCATSLESMVEYITSVLATRNVLALSTVMSNEDVPRQKYTIVPSAVRRLSGSNVVACHAMKYPYAVFYCHTTKGISAYRVSSVGEDGTTVEAVAVCHNVIVGPDAYGRKIKAGDSICHLLPPDHIVWSPNH